MRPSRFRLGLATPPRRRFVTPHLLRHSCATIHAEQGMETVALQRYFGWKAIDTALHYVHLSGHHILEAARAARAARPPLPAGHIEDRV